MKRLLPGALVALALQPGAAWAQETQDAAGCGSLENRAYGPYDYRQARPNQRELVEHAHFTPKVEALRSGQTGAPGWDIGYTLRAFPNHPRALLAMQGLVVQENKNPARDAIYTIECYYERALRFQRDDHVVRMLYANFLIGKNQFEDATKQLDYIIEIQADEPFTQFNVGMLFFDMKNYDRALEQAHKAIALGFMRTDLKQRLSAVGRWVEPKPEAADAPASAASAASAP